MRDVLPPKTPTGSPRSHLAKKTYLYYFTSTRRLRHSTPPWYPNYHTRSTSASHNHVQKLNKLYLPVHSRLLCKNVPIDKSFFTNHTGILGAHNPVLSLPSCLLPSTRTTQKDSTHAHAPRVQFVFQHFYLLFSVRALTATLFHSLPIAFVSSGSYEASVSSFACFILVVTTPVSQPSLHLPTFWLISFGSQSAL